MIIKIKKKYVAYFAYLALCFILFGLFLTSLSLSTPDVIAGNTTNRTVIARVNVSNTFPDLYKVVIVEPLDPQGNIDLGAGNATTIVCNGTFQDSNGFDDVLNVSATLYHTATSNAVSANDNNNHYTNRSCGNCSVAPNSNNINGTCACQFAVQYYANAGNWQCNMSINDSGGLSDFNMSLLTNLNEILGIAVESSVMDYGNLSVTQVSGVVRQNITNIGNIPMNVTVRGYGGDDEEIGSNVSMICDTGSTTNITTGYHRFSITNVTTFGSMFNLTNQTRQIINLTIPQRTADNGYGNSSNSTFWRLEVPLGASGICNGTIIFGGYDALNR